MSAPLRSFLVAARAALNPESILLLAGRYAIARCISIALVATTVNTIIVEANAAGAGITGGGITPTPPPAGHTITSLSPSSARQWDGQTAVTVVGTGFATDASVKVDGVTVPTHYVSAEELTAYIPSGGDLLSPLASATVKLVRVDQGGTSSANTQNFTVTAFNPPTALAGVTVQRHAANVSASLTVAGTRVTAWADQSAGAHNFVDPSTIGPTLSATTGPNGGPCVRFNGTNNQLLSSGWAISQPYAVIMLMRVASDCAVSGRFQDGGTNNESVLNASGAATTIAQYAGSAFANGTNRLGVNNWGVVTAVFNGASSSMRVSDHDTISGATPGASNVSNGFRLGSAAASNYAKYDLAERIVLSPAPAAADLTAYENYLRYTYALPKIHTHAIICEGDSLTFGQSDGGGSMVGATYPNKLVGYLTGGAPKFGAASNVGVSGSTYNGTGGSSSLAARKAAVRAFGVGRVCIVGLWCATNDVHYGRTSAQIIADMRAYSEEMRSLGKKVVVATIIDREWTSDANGTAAAKRTIAGEVNTALRAAVVGEWFDALADFAASAMTGEAYAYDADGSRNVTPPYVADKIHLRGEGYDDLAHYGFAPKFETLAA